MNDNIADKARAYLALSKAATPGPWYAEGRGGAQMDGLRDGYEIYSTEHPKIARLFDTTTGRSGKANDANLIVLGRNIGDEMAEALLAAVEALEGTEAVLRRTGHGYMLNPADEGQSICPIDGDDDCDLCDVVLGIASTLHKIGIGVGDE